MKLDLTLIDSVGWWLWHGGDFWGTPRFPPKFDAEDFPSVYDAMTVITWTITYPLVMSK